MMRRSKEIPTCLVLLAAAAAVGCNERRDCVDDTGHKKPDSYCSTAQTTGTDGAHGSSGHFIYGGSGGRNVGDTVSGGSVTRGGFGGGEGGEGGGHGGEGGEGGGHGGGE